MDIARKIYGEEAEYIIKSFDLIGDIAIIKIPHEILDERRYIFGEEIIKNFSYIKSVYRQKSKIEGLFRLRELEYLAGEERTETLYKEHGSRFLVDISKIYFTPRLSFERARIASLVSENEIVFNMFAGAGPFTILIAKKGVLVHSADINPYAFEYHLANNILNKVEDKVVLYRGDSANIALRYLEGKVDRVIMPLPELALDYLKYALKTIVKRGWIHVYLHIPYKEKEDEANQKAIENVRKEIEDEGYLVKNIASRVVREVAKRTAQVCVDAYVEVGK